MGSRRAGFHALDSVARGLCSNRQGAGMHFRPGAKQRCADCAV
jgi:hypothetical protein